MKAYATIPPERDITLAEARQRVENELSARGLQWQAVAHGSGPYATVIHLHDNDGRLASTGVGKGDTEAALVGGLFEALEHFLSMHHEQSRGHVLLPASRMARGLGEPIDTLLDAQEDTRLAGRVFCGFRDERAEIHPLALFRPTYINAPAPGDQFDYTGLRRYAGNSGTAIGSTLAEAALHALNECIERDDVARMLGSHFHVQQDDTPLRVLDRSTLDPASTVLWRHTEDMIGHAVTVLEIGTHLAAHSYLAFADHANFPVRVYGAGSSACAQHAVSRALTELVQLELLARAEPSVRGELARAEQRLRPWPRAQRACIADFPSLLRASRTYDVPLPEGLLRMPPRAQLKRTLDRLAAEGYRPLLHTIQAPDDGVALCQVLVPGFDRYFLVAHGNPVVPGFTRPRAMAHG